MRLPDCVTTYFDADRRSDPTALISAFSEDAIVRDEGGVHHGHDAIRAWWTAAKQKYQQTATPLEATTTGGMMSVAALVSGKFPGSPATLTFNFTLRDSKIAELQIG
ncbi:MAG: hypothetical protein JWN07_160 [Hyphomicrobiales bacterium]|nr:hypothetical protein [Hyphomicrobiales bacterium]